jgi:hypothetical protein
MKKLAGIILLTGCLVACSRGGSHKPLEIDQMKQVMWDLMKATEWHSFIIAKDTALRNKKEDIRLYAQVFAIHNITKERFYRSYQYYEAHPNEFKILIDSIDNFSAREKSHLGQNHGQAR